MTVFYETTQDKSGNVLHVPHIRTLKSSGNQCCSGSNPDLFCASCKAEIHRDFARLESNEVRPVTHYFIPSTGERIPRPEPRIAKRKSTQARTATKPSPPRAAAQPPSNEVPSPPSILEVVRHKAKSLMRQATTNIHGVPEPKSLEQAIRERKSK